MVSAVEHDTLGYFAYACTVDDFIRAIHRLDLGFNLRTLFDKLLSFLANNLPVDKLLPLLDLVELGC